MNGVFLEERWFLVAAIPLIVWSGYLLLKAYRTGDITAVGDINLEATRNDPAFWRWFINALNVLCLMAGLWLLAHGLGL